MTTQKQIKEWVPEAVYSFQSIMPPMVTELNDMKAMARMRGIMEKKKGMAQKPSPLLYMCTHVILLIQIK